MNTGSDVREAAHDLPVLQQCELLDLPGWTASGFKADLVLRRRIDEVV